LFIRPIGYTASKSSGVLLASGSAPFGRDQGRYLDALLSWWFDDEV